MKRKIPTSGPRLFSEPQRTPHPPDMHTANVDGAARGNPGPAAYAVIIRSPNGQIVFQLGKYLGRATNNVAEYYGLISALDYAAGHGIRRLRVRSDSELLVRQMQGHYKVKSLTLAPLHERAQKLARAMDYFAIEHVRREFNAEADALCNEALDGAEGGPRATASANVAPGFSPARPSNAKSAQSASAPSAGLKAGATKRIRAVYRDGVLYPLDPV
ncbi:MAG: ribonuclease HI family protein, partial [Candidatus Acidiferrales bacterium]